jgi:hypothetical protein
LKIQYIFVRFSMASSDRKYETGTDSTAEAKRPLDRAKNVVVKGASAVVRVSEVASGISEALAESEDTILSLVPVVAGVWSATSSLLEAIADAPMVGPAVKLLLLFAKAVTAVAGYESLVSRAKKKIADFAQALKDIDGMIPPGATPTKTLQTWLEDLRSTLQGVMDENAGALKASAKPTFVMRLLCAVKGAVFDAERIESALNELDTKW